MSAASLFPWRTPLPADWAPRCDALGARVRDAGEVSDEDGIELRRLASCQVGPREQLKLERAARRVVACERVPKSFRRIRIGLLASRTLSFLVDPLAAAGPARGLLVQALEAPYDHIGSFAYESSNPFEGEALDAVAIVLDEQTFPGGETLLDPAAERERVEQARTLIAALVDGVRTRVGCRPIVATIPQVAPHGSADIATAGAASRLTALVNRIIVDGARDGEWVVWDLDGLASRVGYRHWSDPVRYHQAKTPFAVEVAPLAADHLCALLAALSGKSGRALVFDLDNTIWGGVIGDDGVAGIRLGQNSPEGEAYVAFQRFLLSLRERGIVLAACSKNTDEIARQPFRTHPDMALRESHIAVFQANWNDKATNLQSIAETLNLGLESLVFVDDNPAERERVRQALPLVHVPEMGDDPAWYAILIADSGLFEHIQLNAEDLQRADAYGAEARRAEIRANIGDYDEYLASLRMRMDVRRFDAVGRPRIAQLINKSNQFNLTTRRYNEEDLRRMETDPNVLCWQVRLDDAFGAHGMIAVVIVHRHAVSWVIDTWLQSCRVLKRGVEETLMNLLLAEARAAGVQTVTGEYIPTPRNGLVADFYDRMGFTVSGGDGETRYEYASQPAAAMPLKSFIVVEYLSDGVLS